ncbi:hypothetical protein PFISCL1PPCAC_3344, partial [Pristionchus fissidentatus]
LEQLRADNELSSACNPQLAYDRACRVCFTPAPLKRAVFIACGHVTCLACAMELKLQRQLVCPFCRRRSNFVKLFEEMVEEQYDAPEEENTVDTVIETATVRTVTEVDDAFEEIFAGAIDQEQWGGHIPGAYEEEHALAV